MEYELAIYTFSFVKYFSLQNIFPKNIVNRLLISCTSDTTFKTRCFPSLDSFGFLQLSAMLHTEEAKKKKIIKKYFFTFQLVCYLWRLAVQSSTIIPVSFLNILHYGHKAQF